MQQLRPNQIGFVSHYSEQGKWAFKLAFELAKRKNLQLNIFCFSDATYTEPFNLKPGYESPKTVGKSKLVDEERKLREHYDEYLDDYLDVGFKLCTRKKHSFEIKSCMIKNEFQILVIPYVNYEMKMDEFPILEFAGNFGAPVILVGPEMEHQYHINYPATIMVNLGSLPERFKDSSLVREIPADHNHIRF